MVLKKIENIFVSLRTMYKILYKRLLRRVVLGWVEALCCKGLGRLAGVVWVGFGGMGRIGVRKEVWVTRNKIYALGSGAFPKRVRKQPFKGPVSVTFFWDDNLDSDNHAALGKMMLDAMKGWVVQDDSRRWVKGTCHWFADNAGEIRVEVREL